MTGLHGKQPAVGLELLKQENIHVHLGKPYVTTFMTTKHDMYTNFNHSFKNRLELHGHCVPIVLIQIICIESYIMMMTELLSFLLITPFLILSFLCSSFSCFLQVSVRALSYSGCSTVFHISSSY